jgi:hypothetical protein
MVPTRFNGGPLWNSPSTRLAAAGGIGGRSIDDHVQLLADLLEAWGLRNSERDASGHDYFPGRPGFWHALDELYPLQDPNCWARLRVALTRELESRGWERLGIAPNSTTRSIPK